MTDEPEPSYRIEAFADQDGVSTRDVIDLWTGEGGLKPEEAERRIGELLLIATDAERRLAGICTAFVRYSDRLRAPMWNYRTFISEAHRQSHIALALALRAHEHLEQAFVTGEDRSAIGIMFEIESEILKRFEPNAVWPRTGFWFIGEAASGVHIRVRYFPGALTPEPDA
jgi:hypothetical protein